MKPSEIELRTGSVTCVDEFLEREECEVILADLRHTWWWRSPIIRLDDKRQLVSGHSIARTSTTTDETWFGDDSRALLAGVKDRLARAFDVPLDRFETWQAARYRAGELFEEHHDGGFFDGDPWGERTISVLIYLSDSPSGGSTYFPRLRQRFQPAMGRMLVWPNLLPDGTVDQNMRHVACPARRVKTIVSTWVRELPTTPVVEPGRDDRHEQLQ